MKSLSRSGQLIAGIFALTGIAAVVGSVLLGVGIQSGWIVFGVSALLGTLATVASFAKSERARVTARKSSLESTRTLSAVASSVGKSAPVVREIEKQVGLQKRSLGEIATDVRKSSQLLQNAAVTPPRRVQAPSSAPTSSPRGMAAAVTQLASVQAPTATSPGGGRRGRFNTHVAAPPSIQLSNKPVTSSITLTRATSVSVTFHFRQGGTATDSRGAVVFAKVLDASGASMEYPVLASKSEGLGRFTYVETGHEERDVTVHFRVPKSAATLELGVIAWSQTPEIANDYEYRITQETPGWETHRTPRQVKVAAILDEFSMNSFRFECDILELDPKQWRKQLDEFQPDLFLCESAWSGSDSAVRPWKGRVYASANLPGENRRELLDILEYCRETHVPTVFWNKEDPSHYDDKVHNFVDTAVRFDHVFTTDLASVSRYRLEHGHPSVHVLPFGVQPRLFNPVESAPRSDAVVFAGGWYANHRARCDDMRTMFDAVLASGRELKIYDRYYQTDDGTHTFPEKYAAFRVPPVPHDQVADVYRESSIGMTINTETRSRTMFARRVFELMACNTLPVSNYSVGVEEFFGEGVIFLDRDPEALGHLSEEEIDRLREQNLTLVLREHTYAARFAKILDVAGVGFRRDADSIALVMRIDRAEDIDAVASLLRLVTWNGPRVLLLSESVAPIEFGRALERWSRAGIRIVDGRLVASGLTDAAEFAGDATHVLVVPSTVPIPDETVVDRLRTHASYADSIVLERAAGEDRYRYVTTAVDGRAALVPSERLAAVVNHIGRGNRVLAFIC